MHTCTRTPQKGSAFIARRSCAIAVFVPACRWHQRRAQRARDEAARLGEEVHGNEAGPHARMRDAVHEDVFGRRVTEQRRRQVWEDSAPSPGANASSTKRSFIHGSNAICAAMCARQTRGQTEREEIMFMYTDCHIIQIIYVPSGDAPCLEARPWLCL